MEDSDDLALRRAVARAERLRAAIESANQQVANLQAEIRAQRADLRKVERFIDSWRTMAGHEASSMERPRNPKRRDVADAALEIIRKLGRPLSRRSLFEQLAKSGIEVAGKDPEMVLGTMLYRDDRIVRLRGHGYWPKDEVWEPAFYIPEHEAVIGATQNPDFLPTEEE